MRIEFTSMHIGCYRNNLDYLLCIELEMCELQEILNMVGKRQAVDKLYKISFLYQ